MVTSIIPIPVPQVEALPHASVLRLPTGRLDPVLQNPRRGRLPACVPSLRAVRLERQRVADAIAKKDFEVMRDACIRSLGRIHRGEVKGLAIIEIKGDLWAEAFAAGIFQDDHELLTDTLYAFGDADDPWVLGE